MTIPAPNLDDRSFQDIVNEAKRQISRRCPQWTDHNVSDPGVALIELFAWMTDMMLYRVNQVPDRLYVKFLELVGVQLYPATPARTRLLFGLAAPTPEPVVVRAGTRVGTDPDRDRHQVVFMTDEDLELVQPQLVACVTGSGTEATDRGEALARAGERVPVFPGLHAGDAFYLGFAGPLSANLIRLDVTVGAVEGAGIKPTHPPRTWQCWTGRSDRDARWADVPLLSDTSEGFNSSGEVTILLEPHHRRMSIGSTAAYWIRCRLDEPEPGRPTYHTSPYVEAITATGLGGAVGALHAEQVPQEVLGVSTGLPGQTFTVRRAPVLTRRPDETVAVTPPRREPGDSPEPVRWQEVESFADQPADAQVFTWSGATGEIRFGPRVVGPDGVPRQYGAIPAEDAQIWVTGYRYGGGRRGNVGPGALTALLTTIRSVETVRNLEAATGGVDAETVDNAKLRGPLELRGGNRAVTAEDFERLTLEAARDAARARCLAPETPDQPVRILVVPRVRHVPESLTLAQLALSPEIEDDIKAHLDPRRLLTTRVVIDVPQYQGITVEAEVRAAPTVQPERVRAAAEAALYEFINPITGGPDGTGWPFGLDLSIGDIFSVLRSVPGLVRAETVRMFLADLRGGVQRREAPEQRVPLPPGALFLSLAHKVTVRP